LRISSDGFFFDAGEPGPPLTAVELERAADAEAIADAGATGVLVDWPPKDGLVEAARSAGLLVVAKALPEPGPGRVVRRRAAELASHPAGAAVALWLVPDGHGNATQQLACGLRDVQGELVAAPVSDPWTGACPGQAATGSAGGVAELLDLQLAARRRPFVALPGANPASEALAADLGAACLVVTAARGGARAAAGLVERERRRLDAAPAISVVVCAYNAERELPGCLCSLAALRYPRFEVLVVDDGSSDETVGVARAHGVKVVTIPRLGISAARNAGVRAAEGEVVAFLDADEEAPPDWLGLLWRGMEACGADAVTGPNLPFPRDGLQARAVSTMPGAAVPVVRAGGEAEHLTSCNMAVRRPLLQAVAFDERRAAGEDVAFSFDARDSGARLYYLPTAAVWHHRRATVRGFLRQQVSYGEAVREDLEERFSPGERGTGRRRLGRPVFRGSEAAQLFAHADYPAASGLPLRLMAILAAGSAAGLPVAAARGRVGRWAACSGASLGAVVLWVVVAVPVFAPRSGPAGLWQRLLTAAIWIVRPAAHRLGGLRGRRRRARGETRDPVTEPHR